MPKPPLRALVERLSTDQLRRSAEGQELSRDLGAVLRQPLYPSPLCLEASVRRILDAVVRVNSALRPAVINPMNSVCRVPLVTASRANGSSSSRSSGSVMGVRASSSVGLSEFVDFYPGELSGGMQQRVAVEAAYLADRVVVLTDSPATVESVVAMSLPRPRERSLLFTPEFTQAVESVDRCLRRWMDVPDVGHQYSPQP